MINKIWAFLILLGIVISIFTGQINSMGDIIVHSSKDAFKVFLNIATMIIFWSGIFQIAIDSGLMKIIANLCQGFLLKLFPSLEKNHPALPLITNNIAANFLGLGSAATPLGLKAMEALKQDDTDTTNRAMIILVLLNASAPSIIPATILSLRSLYQVDTSNRLLMIMIGMSLCSCMISLLLERFFYRITRNKPC